MLEYKKEDEQKLVKNLILGKRLSRLQPPPLPHALQNEWVQHRICIVK